MTLENLKEWRIQFDAPRAPLFVFSPRRPLEWVWDFARGVYSGLRRDFEVQGPFDLEDARRRGQRQGASLRMYARHHDLDEAKLQRIFVVAVFTNGQNKTVPLVHDRGMQEFLR